MRRVPLDLPEPLLAMLAARGCRPVHIVPSAIGLPADLGISAEEWEADAAMLRASADELLAELQAPDDLAVQFGSAPARSTHTPLR